MSTGQYPWQPIFRILLLLTLCLPARTRASYCFLSMMSNETCVKCGAEMLAGAKFCRRCGQPVRSLDHASVTEAETRIFGETPPTASGGSQPVRLKRHGILWGSAIVVVIILLFGVVVAVKWTSTSHSPVSMTKPDVPPPPLIDPPQPTSVEKGKATGLDYPGAEITMEMTRGAEGSVRQLRTTDSFDKVVAWYTDKLKPTRIIKAEGSAVLTGTNTTAVITTSDDETTVVLKEGIDQ